jgi:hypothetical protein
MKLFDFFNLFLLFLPIAMIMLGIYVHVKTSKPPGEKRIISDRDELTSRSGIPGYVQYKFLGEKLKGSIMLAMPILLIPAFVLFTYITFHNLNTDNFENWINPFFVYYFLVGFYFSSCWSMIDVNAYCNRMNMPGEFNIWKSRNIKNTRRAMWILVISTILILIAMTKVAYF